MAVTWRRLVLESDSNWVDLTDGGATTLHKHDHGGQDGLTDDDHTQYALLAGRATGQTLYGGTASGDDLTLESTSHATKGYVIVQPSGGNFGVGTTSPAVKFEVSGAVSAAPLSKFSFSSESTGLTDDYATLSLYNDDTTANNYAQLSFDTKDSGGNLSLGAAIFGIFNDHTNGSEDGSLAFVTKYNGIIAERVRIESSGNVKIGGTADRATTVGTRHIDIFNGTAPAGTLSNGGSIYASSGELYMMDAAGNATLQTPHDEDGNWIFYSRNTVTGRVLCIDMEKMMKAINDRFGWNFVKEYATDVPN